MNSCAPGSSLRWYGAFRDLLRRLCIDSLIVDDRREGLSRQEGQDMSEGVMLFYGGAGLLALAVVLTVIACVTGRRSKRKMEQKMKERY